MLISVSGGLWVGFDLGYLHAGWLVLPLMLSIWFDSVCFFCIRVNQFCLACSRFISAFGLINAAFVAWVFLFVCVGEWVIGLIGLWWDWVSNFLSIMSRFALGMVSAQWFFLNCFRV